MKLRNITTIAAMSSKHAHRDPGIYFLQVIFMPISILIPLVIVSGGKYTVDIAIGSLLYTQIVMTIQDVGDTVVRDRDWGLRSFFITRPVSPVEYMLGIAIAKLEYSGVGAGIMLAIVVLFLKVNLGVFELAVLIAILLAGWFISSLIGFIVGEYGPKDWLHNDAVSGVVSFIVTFLAPVYYPLSSLPGFLEPLSYCFYTTHLALIGKEVMAGSPIDLVSVIITVFFLISCLIIAIKGIKWKEL